MPRILPEFTEVDQSNGISHLRYEYKSLEKLPVKIWKSSLEASKHIAQSIALAIRQRQQDGKSIVLGLATGSSPIKVYDELVRMHKEEGLSFANVITFNLDEYYPMDPDSRQSYWHFMHEYLFDHVDIDRANIHIPDGKVSMSDLKAWCEAYETEIQNAGGLDIQLLGIGRSGHIGFNEPGSWENSITRLIMLDNITRQDAIKDFVKEENVPFHAVTMGIKTIMHARKVFLLAWGEHKAPIMQKAVEGEVSSAIPATFLQRHPNIQVHLDQAAATELTKNKSPWLVGMTAWNDDLICRAVVWLSQRLSKPILKLTDEDYNENGLSELILELESAYDVNLKIFNRLQHTITGWPGGKPNADDTNRPERAEPAQKRVIIFSPHPDDDVISMGGTFLRLIRNGHDVHVAYQTSGNLAVHNHDALKYAEFVKEFLESNGKAISDTEFDNILNALHNKKHGQPDVAAVAKIKGLIRRGEARAGARFCGAKETNIHFLDLPFYETGSVRKKELSEADIEIVEDLIRKVQPHQIFAAGDLADPHDTHRKCLNVILEACDRLNSESWMQDCWLWLYRGAWHEWSIDEIEMAVPLSPQQLLKKRSAIFMHQSQKDTAPFPGEDQREFWQRSEERNRRTAVLYNQLGFADYEAMEAFVRWKFDWQSQ